MFTASLRRRSENSFFMQVKNDILIQELILIIKNEWFITNDK
jgi:hypothetical protein